jgi:copper(I)-binding protein
MKHHTPFSFFASTLATAVLALSAASAWAQPVQVSNAWVRTTSAGQQSTGAYMALTAPTDMTLVSVSTPAAGIVEVHEMKMEGDIMRMREIPQLALPAGQKVELKPGGLHVMLMDLKQPFTKDARVPFTLNFKDAKGVDSQLNLTLPVARTAPATAAKK